MRKKGFTLVEMLAVITILGVVLMVAIPSIQNQVNSKRKDVDKRTTEMILSAAENYVSGNPNTYLNVYQSGENKNTYCLTVQTLIDADMLEAPVKIYSTGKEVNPNLGIKVDTNKNKEFVYSLLKEGESCVGTTAKLTLYKDPNLKASSRDSENPYPELYTGMIPVVYDEGSNSWKKANLYTSWYEYSTDAKTGYRWANAVTVAEHSSKCEATKTCIDNHKSHGRDYYNTAIAGTTISMDDITGMYVWIPRYQYNLKAPYGVEYPSGDGAPNVQAPGLINVKFLSTTAAADTNWHIPSAFEFGTSTLTGFWMAKFETSPDSTSTCYKTPNDTNCNKDTINAYVVPNRHSWNYIDVANAFKAGLNMSVPKNIHGLKNSQIDTHMTKNAEWGAVSYLSQSEYGIRKLKGASATAREISDNNYFNNNRFWTGCSAGRPADDSSFVTTCPAEHRYSHPSSAAGTTSGTIYGVYDMSGGAWDMVSGVLKDNWGNYKSNFVGKNKYFDQYGANLNSACEEGVCYGHALSETNNWYHDYNTFINTSEMYLYRGGRANMDSTKGIYAFGRTNGAAGYHLSFRVSITRKGY